MSERMADYYPVISRAVAGLDPNTGEARRKVYERARAAITSGMSQRPLVTMMESPRFRKLRRSCC